MECGNFGKGGRNSDQDVGIPIPTKENRYKFDGDKRWEFLFRQIIKYKKNMTESELRRPESEFRRPCYSGVGIGSSVCTSLPLARRVARALRCIL